jgi:hypothetical protein
VLTPVAVLPPLVRLLTLVHVATTDGSHPPAARPSVLLGNGLKPPAFTRLGGINGKIFSQHRKRSRNALGRRKKGTLKRGKGGKGGTVKSKKQAIAIALSEARKKGKKAPRRQPGKGRPNERRQSEG